MATPGSISASAPSSFSALLVAAFILVFGLASLFVEPLPAEAAGAYNPCKEQSFIAPKCCSGYLKGIAPGDLKNRASPHSSIPFPKPSLKTECES